MIDAVVAAARAAAADAPAVLERWARQPSGSHDPAGLAAMLALVAARTGVLPGTVEEVPLHGGAPALRLGNRGDAARRVLLVGHYDTVFTAQHPAPPVVRTSPDVLTGPGVADMKGGILVLLAALAGLEASPAAPGLGWEVLLTPDEELGAPRSLGALLGAARVATSRWCSSPRRATGTWWWRAGAARCSRSMWPAAPRTPDATRGTAAAPSRRWRS